MSEQSTVTAAVIVIGNEVLSGRTHDVNLRFLAQELGALGIRVTEARVIPDNHDTIVDTVNELRRVHTYVFTTGGIGPTHDDITSKAVADAFGVPLERNPDAEALLRSHYDPDMLNEARLSMADIPAGAALIPNRVSKAPGFIVGNVHVLAGVPRIVEAMMDELRPLLSGGVPLRSRTIAANVMEGTLAGPLGDLAIRFPDVDLGSYPYFRHGNLGVSVVARAVDAGQLDDVVDAVSDLMRGLGGKPEEEEGEAG